MAGWLWGELEQRVAATPALTMALDERGRTLTFTELAERAERFARMLAGIGVGPGTPVAWQLPTWLDSLVVLCACSRLGAVQSPLLPLYRERELAVVYRQLAPAVVLAPTRWRGVDYLALHEEAARARPESGRPILLGVGRDDAVDGLVGVGGAGPGELPDEQAARPAEGTTRWVFFTSGTTSEPKGARHTDDSMMAGPRTMTRRLSLTETDRYPVVYPLTHVGGIGTFAAQLFTGMSAVLEEQFDPEHTIDRLSASGITVGAGGTALVQLYLEHQRRHPERPLFPGARFFLTGSAPKPPTLHAAVRAELGGVGCISTYGLTEAPSSSIGSPDDGDEALSSAEGRAIEGSEIRIVLPDGTGAGPGEVGEVRIRGPQVCLGYLDASLDAAAFDASGFLCTGDLGTLDAGGNLRIVGRLKDVIIRKGENISAREVEEVLATMDGVADVAVIGLPDEATGERCCAVVVPTDPADPPTLADVVEAGRAGGLARHKLPEHLVITDVLPRNSTGKVQKSELRDQVIGRVSG